MPTPGWQRSNCYGIVNGFHLVRLRRENSDFEATAARPCEFTATKCPIFQLDSPRSTTYFFFGARVLNLPRSLSIGKLVSMMEFAVMEFADNVWSSQFRSLRRIPLCFTNQLLVFLLGSSRVLVSGGFAWFLLLLRLLAGCSSTATAWQQASRGSEAVVKISQC